MTIRPVVITGEPVLHRRAEPVEVIDDDVRELVADMYETMDAARGVGLAAPQIGVGLRIFTWQLANDDGIPPRGVVINPYLVAAKPVAGDPDPHEESEGCLSVPGESFPLRRGRAGGAHRAGRRRQRAAVRGDRLVRPDAPARVRPPQRLPLRRPALRASYARKAKKAVKANGWGTPGLTWMPGRGPRPVRPRRRRPPTTSAPTEPVAREDGRPTPARPASSRSSGRRPPASPTSGCALAAPARRRGRRRRRLQLYRGHGHRHGEAVAGRARGRPAPPARRPRRHRGGDRRGVPAARPRRPRRHPRPRSPAPRRRRVGALRAGPARPSRHPADRPAGAPPVRGAGRRPRGRQPCSPS